MCILLILEMNSIILLYSSFEHAPAMPMDTGNDKNKRGMAFAVATLRMLFFENNDHFGGYNATRAGLPVASHHGINTSLTIFIQSAQGPLRNYIRPYDTPYRQERTKLKAGESISYFTWKIRAPTIELIMWHHYQGQNRRAFVRKSRGSNRDILVDHEVRDIGVVCTAQPTSALG